MLFPLFLHDLRVINHSLEKIKFSLHAHVYLKGYRPLQSLTLGEICLNGFISQISFAESLFQTDHY